MQKLSLRQTLTPKLSPQQIQFTKLLQVRSDDMGTRIEEELELNPALEEGKDKESEDEDSESTPEEEVNIETYLRNDDTGYKLQNSSYKSYDKQERETRITIPHSLNEQLLDQLSFLELTEHQQKIGQQIIGSIESDGYIRRNLHAIVDDLAFTQYIETSVEEVEKILKKIQSFDPPGIGARNLQECLLLQLKKKEKHSEINQLAISIIDKCFDEFTKKHYDKITRKLGITNQKFLKEALNVITKLDPKPGSSDESRSSQVLYPDFVVTKQHGHLEVLLRSSNVPELRVRKNYTKMLETYQKRSKKNKKLKEAASFVRQKLEAAKWFINAIKQRQQTLLSTMEAILKFQHDFFIEEEESKLKPMILKDIAEEIGMDISTVSRIVSNKAVQTDFSIYPLKFFFSEAVSTTSGEDISNREVKKTIIEIIKNENRHKPYSDEKIVSILKEKKGYNIARRTVAKYREQLSIPVARLRKEV
ncbi:MAG: RNA polymerase factor sigma-54 [Cytophagales bacterium]|nr:RNA polymerase factor sigma-54 [Cytophagales bacterium]